MLYIVAKASFQPMEQSYIATFGESIGKLMGLRQFFISIGMVFGPLLLGILHGINETLSFYVSALLFIIAFIFVVLAQKTFIKKS
jgi:DHA1 family multidrug resistance protein-like MFS transporter